MNRSGNLWAIVLAAGQGHRLQDFLRRRGHREPIKQFCAVVGRRTMLEHTWDRVELTVARDRVLTVVDAAHRATFHAQLSGRAEGTVISQPANRETGPGTMLPLAHVLQADPDAIVGIFPSDHFVGDDRGFMAHVDMAQWVVHRGLWDVVLLGAPADGPDREYGWIEADRFGRPRTSYVLPVRRFWEKPRRSTALRLYEDGHLWSTMVTIARAARLWELIETVQPELCRLFGRVRAAVGTVREAAEVQAVYERLPSVSLSSGVFERVAPRLAVVPMRDVPWSDWGCEERVTCVLSRLGSASLDSSSLDEFHANRGADVVRA